MGRSGKSWAKIGLFYLVFYGFLAGFFVAMLAVFMTTINDPKDGGPKLTQYIKNQAGLTRKGSLKDTFKGYDSNDTDAGKKYTDNIKSIFEEYKPGNVYRGVCNKTDTDGTPKGTLPCFAENSLLGDCSPDNNATNFDFGYAEKKPCIFIRINRVYDWQPKGSGGFLELKCGGDAHIGTYPDGFLLAAFPYRGIKKHELPLVAVKIDATKMGSDGKVDCELKGDGIEVSSSFNPVRSYGNIRIENVYAKES
jgi:sodium/potassium-transporting ATPase subunit beta